MDSRWTIGLVLAVALAGANACTTKSYAPGRPGDVLELKIKAGDEIRVVTTRRERLGFKVTEVLADRFVGVTIRPHDKELRPAGEPVEVPYEELAMLQVARFDKRSAALAAAVVTVSAFAVVMAPVTVVPIVPPAP